MPPRLASLLGLAGFVLIAWACSTDRKAVNRRLVIVGVLAQLLLGAVVFRFPPGRRLFLAVNDAVVALLEPASEGVRFVFGPLALPPGASGPYGTNTVGVMLAFQAFPLIIVFSALAAILYQAGVMTRLIRAFAWVFTRLLRISGAESLCAASNIFVGVESSLTVKPYLARMTRSELCTVLTAGMATVASNVIGLYVFTVGDAFPTIAGHLVSASLLSAPAAVVMAKLLLPETGRPETLGLDVRPHVERAPNIFTAVIQGANAGVQLILGIVALLIAMLGLVALLDLLLGWVGGGVNALFGVERTWTLERLLGFVFHPLTRMMGVPAEDAGTVADMVGGRLVTTEVVAYARLKEALVSGALVHPRSAVIAAYALCGFAHVASLAIFVGGVAALVPERAKDLAEVGPRALAAATLACLMTGAVAGLFASGEATVLLGAAAAP